MSQEACSLPQHPKRTRRVFTREEDAKLAALVKHFGERDWRIIADNMQNRTPHQCRERYKYYLSPQVVNGPWTEAEDLLLQQKFMEYGPKWSLIQTSFPTRSEVNIKNRWASHSRRLKKMTMANLPPSVVKDAMESESNMTSFCGIDGINLEEMQEEFWEEIQNFLNTAT